MSIGQYDIKAMSARCPVLGFSAGTHPTNPGGSCAADPACIAYLNKEKDSDCYITVLVLVTYDHDCNLYQIDWNSDV